MGILNNNMRLTAQLHISLHFDHSLILSIQTENLEMTSLALVACNKTIKLPFVKTLEVTVVFGLIDNYNFCCFQITVTWNNNTLLCLDVNPLSLTVNAQNMHVDLTLISFEFSYVKLHKHFCTSTSLYGIHLVQVTTKYQKSFKTQSNS